MALCPSEAPPPPAPADPHASAILAAEAAAAPANDLGSLWQAVMDRRLAVHSAGGNPGRKFVLARTSHDPTLPRCSLSRIETAVLVRVLCGEQQKVVASELEIACSTASKWYTQALAKLNLESGPIPLPLIIAAQTWAAGTAPLVDARSVNLHHEGSEFLLLSVPRPAVPRDSHLTHAEQEVAKLLIEGNTRWEIASHRSTSMQTVACQLRGIFAKFRLSGRYALVRRAVELGWFRFELARPA